METKSTDNNSRLLIVGGRGWVGSECLQVCMQLHRFSEIHVTSRDWRGQNPGGGVKLVTVDLSGRDFQLPEAECLFYCAGSVPQSGKPFQGDWQERALDVVLDQFFSRGGQRAFVTSSGAVYEALDIPEQGYYEQQWTPDMGVTALSDYGKAKQCEEIVVERYRQQGCNVAVGRLFAALGTRFDENSSYAFADFIRQQNNEGAIRLRSPDSLRSFVWLPEIALSVCLWLMDGREHLGTFNVTGPNPVSLRQLALGLFPEATLIEESEPARNYFGNPSVMMSHARFRDGMSSEMAIKTARQELGL